MLLNVRAIGFSPGITGMVADDLVQQPPIVAFPDETCRMAAERMAHAGVGRLPIVERAQSDRLVGIVSRSDLLKARTRWVDLEERRERLIRLRSARREKGALKAARPAR